MATLTGSTIASTYLTLLKLTTAALGADASAKFIEDAAGTDSALSISTTRVGIGTASPDGKLHIHDETGSRTTTATAIDQGLILSTTDLADNDYYPAISWRNEDAQVEDDERDVAAIVVQAAELSDAVHKSGVDMRFFVHANVSGSGGLSAATEKMCILQDGNVGIGDPAPSTPLHVSSADENLATFTSSDDMCQILIQDGASGDTLYVGVSDDGGSSNVGLGWLGFNSGNHVNNLNIDANGNVGIGVNAPTSLLSLAGDLGDDANIITAFDSTMANTHAIKILMGKSSSADECAVLEYTYDSGTVADSYLSLRLSGSTGLNIDGNNNVGIGIAAPTTPLHVYLSDDDKTICTLESAKANMNAATDVILKLTFSGTGDVHPAGDGSNPRFIECYDNDGVIGWLEANSDTQIDTAFSQTSDVRLKKNIVDTGLKGLETLNKIKIRDFEWNGERGSKDGKKVTAGFIADEVYEVYPHAAKGVPGAMRDIKDDDGNKTGEEIEPMGVCQGSFINLLMKAVQELSAKVTALENA